MPINTNQQLNLKNKLSKQKNRDRIMDMESSLMVARWEQGVGQWMKRLKKYKQVATEQPWGCKVQYRKLSSLRTYMPVPWT